MMCNLGIIAHYRVPHGLERSVGTTPLYKVPIKDANVYGTLKYIAIFALYTVKENGTFWNICCANIATFEFPLNFMPCICKEYFSVVCSVNVILENGNNDVPR